ncbi:MAG: hypothetical protein IJ124_10935 [Clostridia bacterium]|nr:hypothetical protein [Clostridia bacterium]
MANRQDKVVRGARRAPGRSAYFRALTDRLADAPRRLRGGMGKSPWLRPGYRRRRLQRRRRLWRALAAAAAVALAALGMRLLASSGGVVVLPKREVPSDPVFFYQLDEAWSGDAMGATGRTLGEGGDSVVCLTSLLVMQRIHVPFTGAINPGAVNAWLGASDAYEADGKIRWSAVGQLLGVELTEERARGGMAATLDALIDSGQCAIVTVKGPEDGRLHDVLLVGSNHGKFMVIEPLDPSGALTSLEVYGDRIYAMRYMRYPTETESEAT